MVSTERQTYRFAVMESSDGTPRILLEPHGDSLSCLGNGFLGLDLMPGTDLAKAREIASFLNGHIQKVSHTRVEPPYSGMQD